MPEIERLYSLAEISIGLAGFSAIVVMFRRRDSGTWSPADADRFNGMVFHAMAAAFFCVLPAIVGVFVEGPRVWTVCSAVLGLQIVGHAIGVVLLATTGGWARAMILGGGGAAAGLQALNAFGVAFDHEFGPYEIGVLWHVLHAGFLFLLLVWVPRSAVR